MITMKFQNFGSSQSDALRAIMTMYASSLKIETETTKVNPLPEEINIIMIESNIEDSSPQSNGAPEPMLTEVSQILHSMATNTLLKRLSFDTTSNFFLT